MGQSLHVSNDSVVDSQKLEPLDVRTVTGMVKAIITSPGTPPSFFLRVKVK